MNSTRKRNRRRKGGSVRKRMSERMKRWYRWMTGRTEPNAVVVPQDERQRTEQIHLSANRLTANEVRTARRARIHDQNILRENSEKI